MKYVILMLLCLLQATTYAQSRTDYDAAMGKMKTAYNAQSIAQMSSVYPVVGTPQNKDIATKQIAEWHKQYGDIKSFTYAGTAHIATGPARGAAGTEVQVYKVQLDKGTLPMCLAMSNNKTLSAFQFKATGPEVDALMK